MYELIISPKAKKDIKRYKNSKDIILISDFLKILIEKGVKGVPSKMTPHKLKGEYKDNWECHVKPDLLTIWIQIENPKQIRIVRVGSHSDLFK